jgi:3-dehydroquinate synthase
MTTIEVNVSKKYNVHIGNGLLSECGAMLLETLGEHQKAFIVTDDKVDGLYAEKVEKSLKSAGFSVSKFVFKNGEASKNTDTYIELLKALTQANLTRTDTVIALGGGVAGDLAGFAAATYLRGIGFVQAPTTLLAMVDSSVGGKTGVNLQSGKNQVGAFYQPDMVICDYSALDTLSEEVFRDGCAEIIKHAVIRDSELFELLKQPIKDNIEDIIARNVTIKRDVVALDEKDTGLRQLLNFGHTIGHGIEKCSGYQISHGSAVAIGMVAESRGTPCYGQVAEMVRLYGLPTHSQVTAEQLVNAALSDKKRSGGKITLIVPEKIGSSYLKEYDMDKYLEFVEHGH